MTLVSDINMAEPASRKPKADSDVVLGEDWDRPAGALEAELVSARQNRSRFTLKRSPLARKIVVFNLLAILVLVAGVLTINPSRDSLVVQRELGLVVEAQLIADVFEASLPENVPIGFAAGDGVNVPDVLDSIELPQGVAVHVFDRAGTLVAERKFPGNPWQQVGPGAQTLE